MPPKAAPKIYQLLVKTHTLTVMITAEPKTTIASLKLEVLSALKADVNQVPGVPKVEETEDFEICQIPKARGKPGTQYEVLQESATVAGTVTNWEVLFIQFKDASGKFLIFGRPSHARCIASLSPPLNGKMNLLAIAGKLMPVEVTQPSLLGDDDEEEVPRTRAMPANDVPSGGKGKRKAPDE
ncbi:hypothetical protein HWV62_25549 [Athelia sp. TMB]|nr:hypothetical protein HWV62_25549 [Athelia sp. TMB]